MLLDPNGIWVWYADLRSTCTALGQYWSLLSQDEQMRAQRFYFVQNRDRFIVGRGILRSLLGHITQQSPQALQFDYNPYGKPTLSDYPQLQFNLSHSQDLAIYVFTLEAAIGVDVEYQTLQLDLEKIASRCLTSREYSAISELQAEQKAEAFFKIWACKEAYVKAVGQGLSYPLTKVEISLDDHPVRLITLHDHKTNCKDWSLYVLPYPSTLGFAAALAVKAQHKVIREIHFEKALSQRRGFLNEKIFRDDLYRVN